MPKADISADKAKESEKPAAGATPAKTQLTVDGKPVVATEVKPGQTPLTNIKVSPTQPAFPNVTVIPALAAKVVPPLANLTPGAEKPIPAQKPAVETAPATPTASKVETPPAAPLPVTPEIKTPPEVEKPKPEEPKEEDKLPEGRLLSDAELNERAGILKKAIYGVGTDVESLERGLDKLSEADGKKLSELYKAHAGTDLAEDIKGEFFFESDQDKYLRLLNGMTYKDKAAIIFESLDGGGTDYEKLTSVLKTVKPGEGALIKTYYEERYGSLDEDLNGDLWEAEVVLCKGLLNGMTVQDRVDAAHSAIYGAGTNLKVLNSALLNADLVELAAAYKADPRHKGTTLFKDVLGDAYSDDTLNDIIKTSYPELGPSVVYMRDQIDPYFWSNETGIYDNLKSLEPEKRKKAIEIYDFFGSEDGDFLTLKKSVVKEMSGRLREDTLNLIEEAEKFQGK